MADFKTILAPVPFVRDDYGRVCYHYMFSLEKLGYSTRSGSVWKRARRYPYCFIERDNSTYITSDMAYNLFLTRVSLHNRKVISSPQLYLDFNQNEGGSHANH